MSATSAIYGQEGRRVWIFKEDVRPSRVIHFYSSLSHWVSLSQRKTQRELSWFDLESSIHFFRLFIGHSALVSRSRKIQTKVLCFCLYFSVMQIRIQRQMNDNGNNNKRFTADFSVCRFREIPWTEWIWRQGSWSNQLGGRWTVLTFFKRSWHTTIHGQILPGSAASSNK